MSSLSIRAIVRRPHLDLVGVWVHSAEKVGRDAGEIVGMGPIGVITTGDLDDIIASKPDCVVYGAASAEMDAAAVRDYVRLLNGGLNVVTTNTPGMMFPDRWIPQLADQVREAAMAGGVTIYTSGIELVAKALGVEIEKVTETYERVLTPRDLHVACGTIPAGTCGAVRAETTGVVDGHPVITIEHINRMAPDLAPEWASAPNGTYRLIIEGQPHIECDLRLGTEDTPESANANAMEATAMRVVNAIPYVVDAAPGIATSLDLPITAPRNALDFG
ncbi:dihydrodipicolinate reductase [Mycolicibacterium elephantis]|nr:hypothetical protein [Mycolicibacterium elephantis]OBB25028.1 dihydrodipicolinate reductase [Mycolicibacterium elephantis]